MMRKPTRTKSIVVINVLIITGLIIALTQNIPNPGIGNYQQQSTGIGTHASSMALATDGSDSSSLWVIILILLVVSIIGDIVTIMVMVVKRKDKSDKTEVARQESSSKSQVGARAGLESGDANGIGEDPNRMPAIENAKSCPKCGNILKSEYTTCPFCRRELKK